MYINITTVTQHSEAEIRALYPNTSFPEPFLAPDGYALVFPTPQPIYNSVTQRAQETAPVLTAKGHWEQQWTVVSLFTEYTDEAKVLHTVAAQEAKATAQAQATQSQALQEGIVTATQARLDAFAGTRNYDGILSACTYASSTVSRFAAEGQAAVNARDATWSKLYAILGEVQAGTRPAPTGFADIEASLPALVWPA